MTALNDRTRLTGYLPHFMGKVRIMEQFILPQNFKKTTLLLHSCCAPCSTACIESLKEFFDITVYYYNPNITDLNEYQKRKQEQIRYLNSLGIKFLEGEYNPQEFYDACQSFATEKEGGKRCEKCIGLRISQTGKKASELNFEYYCSTLSVSPHKNAKFINEYGSGLNYSSKYLPTDFKKNNGYLRSVTLSKQFGLYRQNFCGCEYSKTHLKESQ